MADSVKRDAVAEAVKAEADAADAIRAAKQRQGGKNGKTSPLPAGPRSACRAALSRTTPSFSELDKTTTAASRWRSTRPATRTPQNVEEEFKALDTNDDGYLSIDEYKFRPP